MFEYKIIRLYASYSFKGFIFSFFFYPECELYKVQPFEINQLSSFIIKNKSQCPAEGQNTIPV